MKRTWSNPPPVVIVSGTDDFLREREVQKAMAAAQSMGRRIERHIDNGSDLSGVLSGSVMFSGSVLAVVQSDTVVKKPTDKSLWTEPDVQLIMEHHESGDNSVCLLVVHDGEVSESSLAGRILGTETTKKLDQINYTAPKPWDVGDYAVKFLRSELKRTGKSVSDDLAEAIVQSVGTDLGILSHEALKYTLYMDACHETELSIKAVRGLMAAFGATDTRRLVEAVGNRNLKQVSRAMVEVREGPAAQAGVIVVCRTLGTTAVGWLQVAVLQERGLSESEITNRLEWKPGRYRMVAPIAQRWQAGGLTRLLKVLSKVDRDARHGSVAPWAQFESGLLQVVSA